MATLFLDYEGGNDNYGGTSFALLAWGTDGRITSATFSSATASFPNDGSLIGHYLTIWNGTIYAAYKITAWVSGTQLTIEAISGGTALANQAVDRQYYIGGRWKMLNTAGTAVRIVPGDEFRVMSSPDPTSLGLGTWTGGVSYAGSSSQKNIQSSTNASPIVVTSAGHGLVTGDTVEISGHTTNTFANGMWEVTKLTDDTYSLDGSTGNGVGGSSGTGRRCTTCRVILDTASTQKIAGCSLQEGAWTASANVTATVSIADWKGRYGSAEIAVAAGFTTGKAAYFATGTLDLSGYEQVTFWIKQTAGTLGAASSASIVLCSDTAGATPVNTINIPAIPVLNQWRSFTVNTAAALGASIQSVALYINTDNAAQTFRIGNVAAAKAASSDDSLTYTSLIGKNTTGETWYGVRDIDGVRVILGDMANVTSVNSFYDAYDGDTENVTTYKREVIYTPEANYVTRTWEAGTYAAPFTLEGGWNRTDMSSQTGETWYSSMSYLNAPLTYIGNNFWNVDKLNAANSYSTIAVAGSMCNIGTVHGVSQAMNAIKVDGEHVTIDSVFATGCARLSQHQGCSDLVINALRATGCIAGLEQNGATRTKLSNFSLRYGSYEWLRAFSGAGGNIFKNGIIEYYSQTAASGNNEDLTFYAEDCDFTLYSGVNPYAGPQTYSRGYATTKNENGNGVNKIYGAGGSVIIQDTTMAYGTASSSWKMSPASTTLSADWPLYLPLRGIALAANVTKTVGVWMRRDNTGLTMKLVCKGGQLAGIAADVTASMTAAADTWELVQISLTPTEKGAVELEAHAYGGATYNGWVSVMEFA